jgi:hypothetical protein
VEFNGLLESPFPFLGLSNGTRGGFCVWVFLGLRLVEFEFSVTSAVGVCLGVLWIGSRARCASVGWVANGSLESPFQGLSNGARGVFCGWLFLGLRSVEFGFGLTSAVVGLCHNVF